MFRSRAENYDAELTAASQKLPKSKKKEKKRRPMNISNAEKRVLFIKLAPDKTVATERLTGRKKEMNLITFLFCSKSDGFEKIELIFIGKSLMSNF